ncbi:MAG TPA: nucleotidyltransferase [Halanaerobiales bacterium]|nr:nucleotidyltransferase [Halanaerobiales bacterium]
MKVTGLIVEYNPFHKGHKYHIKKSKQITNADYTLAVMSGHFTQRGTPAICDKWNRTKMALKNGVDLLIELPLFFSIRSAEFFAQSAMKLLEQTNIVDEVVFGSENGDIEILRKIASILLENDQYFVNRLQSYLKEGFSFPVARKNALIDLLKLKNDIGFISQHNIFEILNGSNNILGIEYSKTKQKYDLNLQLKTIKRVGQSYYSDSKEKEYISATAVRNAIYQNKLDSLKEKIPQTTYEILKNEIDKNKIPINKENLGLILLSKIRKLDTKEITNIHDINNDLAIRIKNAANNSGDYHQLMASINTRAYTKTRFQRILLNILFNINKDIINNHDYKGPSYIRVLGFNDKGQKLLTKLKENSNLPIITKPANFVNNLTFNNSNLLKTSLSYDIYATNIYTLLYKDAKYRKSNLDFSKKIVKI